MTRFFKQIALLGCLLTTLPLQATVIRVPADELTIQAAVNSASDGDTVVVYPGTYYENVFFRGKKIVLTSRFYETGDLSFVQSTIINGSSPIHSDTASCVLIINGEDSTATLQGFTITGGQGTTWTDEHGAGIYREGGGILIANSAPTIRYNLIVNNEATNTSGVTSSGGGGIRAGDGDPRILNNVLAANQGRYGAGIVLNFTGAIVRNNIITNNSGGQDYGGGALWMNHDGAFGKIIENNTIARNKVLGVYVYQGTSIIMNSIIWGNTSPQIGVRTGGPTIMYSDVQGGWTGVGNIDQAPTLTDTSYCIQTGSPCIDGGDTAVIYNDIEDSLSPGNALWPSRGGIRNDIGAYGGPGAGALPNFSSITGIAPFKRSLPSGFRLEQNYPNPFNPSTIINYELSANSFVTLKVYDALGREVKTLVADRQNAGTHSATFGASHLTSGVYFYTLQAGSLSKTMKLLLLK
ncbi:MAG: T9SS type A sorting domain-containing protein [Candidatus Kryptoniota bacterium]